ncbi:OmpH family outer membrane protein [Rhodovastum atsumiense]|uniref:OmpH family outer membrane protein n=1 Tax=Rhodovastum atsumiense TaxID=504468 RepID=A0A5M6J0P5_9PROT|nr:OmpH family outer membrane protein [Rhodovastum atsumiense]KAA5614160.1 OmpH family outer membrane protein [Rhodovastum atsumiense]CAH2599016.1 OmpH family outer membrane protein [Rhodovastum atsumiense]
MIRLLPTAALITGVVLAIPAGAQQNPDYFIPNQPRQAQPAPAPARPAPAPARPSQAQRPVQVAPQAVPPEPDQPPVQVALPPPPDIPALPRGASPPAAVIGVLGVPEVMRASTAAQQVEKVIGERREKLNEDAQKEQTAWRDMQQALANERGKLSAEQIRGRERELQDRITKAQRDFRERGAIIQQAAQYGLAQIERTLVGVIQRVAESRGMNLVLHRQQVALNVNEFDVTDAVTEQLNKVLPSVVIPPDGVSPATMQKSANGTPAAPAAQQKK